MASSLGCITTNEAQFILTAAREDRQRIDGRGMFDFRKLGIRFLRNRGCVEVSLGDSLVFAAVTSQIEKPYPDRQHEGMLDFDIEFLPMAHPDFESLIGVQLNNRNKRRRNEVCNEIERMLEKTVKKAKAINVESLCILKGAKVWHITVHIHILSHQGNLLDLCNIAALLALSHYRLPEVKIFPDKSIELLDILKPLSVHFMPISITLGILEENVIVLDPLLREEYILQGKVLINMNIFGDILTIKKSGSAEIPQSLLMQCIEVARIKVSEITKHMRNALDTDKMQRLAEERNSVFNLESADKLVASLVK